MPNASYRHDLSQRSSPELPLATVRVPGSTSNLGAGFDCVGMAVDRWLTARVWRDPTQPGPRLVRGGTLQGLAVEPEQDLIWRGITAACTAARVAPPQDLVIEASSDIPVGSGLGSSAAAVVAGVAIATAVLALPLDAQRLGHEAHHERLRDGLPLPYGQRQVVVGLIATGLRHEQPPVHPTHGREDSLIGHSLALDLLDEPLQWLHHLLFPSQILARAVLLSVDAICSVYTCLS